MSTYFYSSPLGFLEIQSTETHITRIFLNKEEGVSDIYLPDIMKKCIIQLDEYFAGRRTNFDLLLDPKGTQFQKSVWTVLQTIPYGVTISYKQLAEKAGSPKGCRAAGNANGHNLIPIIIPCHRVINADGGLGGYTGGLHIKRFLLDLEQRHLHKK